MLTPREVSVYSAISGGSGHAIQSYGPHVDLRSFEGGGNSYRSAPGCSVTQFVIPPRPLALGRYAVTLFVTGIGPEGAAEVATETLA